MTNPMLLAWSSPVSSDREDEFTEWYTNVHVPQVRKAIPAVIATRRYRVLGSGTDDQPVRFLVCYELGEGDAAAAAAALSQARKNGQFTMSDTLDHTVAPPVLEFVDPVD